MRSAIVILDLDQFGSKMKEMGWSEYKPNVITGSLSDLLTNLLSRQHGTHIRGIDYQRGTEEAVLFFSAPNSKQLIKSLEQLIVQIEKLGRDLSQSITLSIGISFGPVPPIRLHENSDLKPLFLYKSAKKALKTAKTQGGNRMVVY